MKKILFCFISILLLTSSGNIFAQDQEGNEDLGVLPQTFYITKTKDPTAWGYPERGETTGASIFYKFVISEYTDILIHTLGSAIPGVGIELEYIDASSDRYRTVDNYDYYTYWEANGVPDIWEMSWYGNRTNFFYADLEPGEYTLIIYGNKVTNYGWVNGPTTMHLAGYKPGDYPGEYPPLYPNTKK